MAAMSDVATASDEADTDVVLDVTETAAAKVMEIREKEDEPAGLSLRVEVTGTNGIDFTYDLSFVGADEAAAGDRAYEVHGLPLVVPADSVDRLRGATLDLPSNPVQGGLVIRNPNRPDLLEGKDIELSGTTAEKLQQLLDGSINPSLAAHGGYAELVGMEGTVAYLSMGGGCQGCAMSAATLREGISIMIAQALPEITDVIDVTDHEAGENPFYS